MSFKLALISCLLLKAIGTLAIQEGGLNVSDTSALQIRQNRAGYLAKDRVDPIIIGALITAGATLVTANGGSSGGEAVYNYHGQNINANECWEDGGGACPNGNCLDRNGPRGVVIQTRTVGCKWFCFHRADCKKQLCCKRASRIIAGRVCARMYEHWHYRGSHVTVNTGSSRWVGNSWNDKMSSVRVEAGCTFTGYEHMDFRGRQLRYTSSSNWVGRSNNDLISSWRCTC